MIFFYYESKLKIFFSGGGEGVARASEFFRISKFNFFFFFFFFWGGGGGGGRGEMMGGGG